ncbi:MAG: hypothetical protein WB729_17020 [Candidatus Sulfotelmatobacter sp.]
MNRVRSLAIALATTFMLALPLVAQQATPTTNTHDAAGGMPSVEQHVKVLAEKLDLTSDQQAKATPILQEMQDATEKSMQDESMSPAERRDHVKASRYKADKKLRAFLTDEQKKKLDQLEDDPHSGMHDN